MVTICNSGGEPESVTVMLVRPTPSVRPVTLKPPPENAIDDGEMIAPGRADEKKALYGGVPPVITKLDVVLTQLFGV